MFGMHLTTKEFVALRDLGIDREPVRVSEGLSDLRDFVIRNLLHINDMTHQRRFRSSETNF